MFVSYKNKVVNSDRISSIHLGKLVSHGTITVTFKDSGPDEVSGPEAFNLVMDLCPNALEGKQAKYKRHAWAVHNLIGHPMMQILSWLHLTKLGIKIHDLTVPNPEVPHEG